MPKFQAPKGTRDLYPEDVLRQRYITQAWRDVSIRHGFDEISGPTFEHLDLYTVKSGEGIVSELFSFRREGGDDDYALRPEFTPTLARMYAARARQLPQPTKWFTAGPYFRAEKPQRGRLREFLQWNVDVMGLPTGVDNDDDEDPALLASAVADAEIIACVSDLNANLGLTRRDVRIRLGHRQYVEFAFSEAGVPESQTTAAFQLLDQREKLDHGAFKKRAAELGVPIAVLDELDKLKNEVSDVPPTLDEQMIISIREETPVLGMLADELIARAVAPWCQFDLSVARGLAYYTGTVFEVIAEGERAVCGGGRYDKLVEMFGGPSTPAVGFGMGDVVLSLLLDDKGLMPEGAELMEAVSRPGASVRPEAFVIPGGEADDAAVNKTVAMLRRGPEKLDDGTPTEELKPWRRPPGLHARRSYKSTRNVGKLLKDATNQHARFAVILETPTEATVKDLDTGEQSDAKYAVGDELRADLCRRLGR